MNAKIFCAISKDKSVMCEEAVKELKPSAFITVYGLVIGHKNDAKGACKEILQRLEHSYLAVIWWLPETTAATTATATATIRLCWVANRVALRDPKYYK